MKTVKKKKVNVVCVIGLGYVGLTLSLVFTKNNLRVYGVDNDKKILEGLESGQAHFYEKGLTELLIRGKKKGFSFHKNIPNEVNINTYVIAVGTSLNKKNKPDFTPLRRSSKEIAKKLKKGDLIILRSTVMTGTTREIVIPLLEKGSGLVVGKDFSVVFAPERTIEGNALIELELLPQIIGGFDKKSLKKGRGVFSNITKRLVSLDSLEEAEMIKMMNNSYRDLIFAFANELALVCDKFNLDTLKVIQASNIHYNRSDIPKPSPGVGGYCLTKDPLLLSFSSEQKGYKPTLMELGRKINESMPIYVSKKIKEFAKFSKNKKIKISILGLPFKGDPPTSDIRFSPALDVIKNLKELKDVTLYGHDPVVTFDVFKESGVKEIETIEEAFQKKDVVLIMNNHSLYKKMNVVKLSKLMNKKGFLFDAWSLHKKQENKLYNDVYYGNLGYQSFRK